MASFLQRAAAFLGFGPKNPWVLEDAKTRRNPRQYQPRTQTRWYMADLDTAERMADNGDLSLAARLMRAARRDGVYSGVLSTRTDGLVRLPRYFLGNPDVIGVLEARHESPIALFDEICRASELALLVKDGIELGVGIAELCYPADRDFPILVRRDPEYLRFNWNDGAYYYQTLEEGLVKIDPGLGRWVLHTPGGLNAPWTNGIWKAVGKAYIRKDHAEEHKDLWEATLANPARIAKTPQGATEQQRLMYLQQVADWNGQPVYGLPQGYDLSLLESNGKGADSFVQTIKEMNEELKIAVTGQTVTTDGGAGFSNSEIHRLIRADLIESTERALAYTINTQVLPIFVLMRWGLDAALTTHEVSVGWDVSEPKELASEASTLVQFATGLKGATEALAPYGLQPDARALATQFGIPVRPIEEKSAPQPISLPKPPLELPS